MEKQATPIRKEPHPIQKKAAFPEIASGGGDIRLCHELLRPAMSEFMYQGYGSSTAASVLHAAFFCVSWAAAETSSVTRLGLIPMALARPVLGPIANLPGSMGTGNMPMV
jgi:hypothetical protein